MSDDDKNYPASDLKLERLRRQGVIARSSDLSSFAIVLGLVLGCCVLVNGAGEVVVGILRICLSGNCAQSPQALMAENVYAMLVVNGLVFVLIVGCLVLVDIVQNKGLFTPGAWRFNLGAPFSFSSNISQTKRRFVGVFLKNALFVGGWLAVVYMLFIAAFQEIIPSVTMMAASEVGAQHWQFYQDFAVQVLIASASACFFFAVLSWFIAILQFRREHRMSRTELEQEYREMEPPPELRRARQDVRDS